MSLNSKTKLLFRTKMKLNLNFSLALWYQIESQKFLDKFDITSSFKLNSKSGNNNETKKKVNCSIVMNLDFKS